MIFALALFVAGCGGRGAASELEVELGQGKLALQTRSGMYELRGSVRLTRQGDPPFSVTASLGEREQSVIVSVPVGSYQAALDPGYRLLRVSDSPPTDLTDKISGPPEIAPKPALVQSAATTLVSISVTLDEAVVVVFGRGAVELVTVVNDDGLDCGGCAPGRVCLARGSGPPRCATPCDPAQDAATQCGAGIECALFYTPAPEGGEAPRYFCDARTEIREFTFATTLDATPVGGTSFESLLVDYRFEDSAASAALVGFADYPLTRVTVKVGTQQATTSVPPLNASIRVIDQVQGVDNYGVSSQAPYSGTLFGRSIATAGFNIVDIDSTMFTSLALPTNTAFAFQAEFQSHWLDLWDLRSGQHTVLDHSESQSTARLPFSIIERRLVVSDFRAPGDHLLVSDPVTHLQWLSPLATRGISLDSIVAGQQNLVTSEGFSIATDGQVQQLLDANFGFPTTTESPANVPKAFVFFDTFGITEAGTCQGTNPPGLCPRTQGWSLAATPGTVRAVGMLTIGNQTAGNVIDFTEPMSQAGPEVALQRGTWLVRSTLPKPVPTLR